MRAGEEILRAGGNAIDAAAAVQLALNVVDPNLSSIGGGANVLVQVANRKTYAIDGREAAPGATTPTMYRGKSAAAVGVNEYSVGGPGACARSTRCLSDGGRCHSHARSSLRSSLPTKAFPVSAFLTSSSADPRVLDMQPEAVALLRRPDGTPLQRGDTFVQHELAKTFRLIAREGPSLF